jgi:hypothetical protein
MLTRFGRDEINDQHAIWIRELVSKGDWLSVYEARQGRPVKCMAFVEDWHGLSSRITNSMKLDQDG